jgi:hypothetical protein
MIAGSTRRRPRRLYARARSHRAASLHLPIMTSAAARSLSPLAFAAVTVPSFLNAGRIAEIDSIVAPARMSEPLSQRYVAAADNVVEFYLTDFAIAAIVSTASARRIARRRKDWSWVPPAW